MLVNSESTQISTRKSVLADERVSSGAALTYLPESAHRVDGRTVSCIGSAGLSQDATAVPNAR